MAEGGDGMEEGHPRTGPTHDGTDLLPPVGAVAVYGTFPAGRLTDTETATAQPLPGIFQ